MTDWLRQITIPVQHEYRKSKRPFPSCLDEGQSERKLGPTPPVVRASRSLLHSSGTAAPALAKGGTALRSLCEQRLGKAIAITAAWSCSGLPEEARMPLATTATY
jgi:hypothetical protein